MYKNSISTPTSTHIHNNLKQKILFILQPENGNSTQFMSEELPRALSQSEMEMIEARMAQRNERLAEKCTEFGLDVHGKVFSPLFF